MEIELFEKVFDITNLQQWKASNNVIKLKAEILRAYGYIDSLTPVIASLHVENDDLVQQLAQLSQSAERSLPIQISGSTGLTGYNKNLILEGHLFLFFLFFLPSCCTTLRS